MIRIVIENILLFLLPTFVYVAWILLQRMKKARENDDDQALHPMAGLLDDAPLLWLFACGVLIVMLTFATFGTYSGGKPGQNYQPSVLKDGKIQPGNIR